MDITGEISWAGEMRVAHGEAAKKSGARIISFCGFDSIPSDMSIFAAIQALKAKIPGGEKMEIEQGTTWHVIEGGANGGTIQTALITESDTMRCFRQPVPFLVDDPLVLAHPRKRFDPNLQSRKNNMAKAEWFNQLISFDPIMMLGVSVPFFMAVINAKIVHASAIALNYGPNFVYRERLVPVGFQPTSRLMVLSIIPAIVVQIATVVLFVIIKLPIIGAALVDRFIPPGSGPSEESCRNGKAEVYAEVTTSKDSAGNIHRANCLMKFKGDPGNYVTSQCLCEAAWCLLLHRNELPPRSDDGFGTPAELLGSVLLKRLMMSKVRPVVVSTSVRQNVSQVEWTMFR